HPRRQPSPMNDAGKATVLEYVAAFNAGDIDRLRTLFTPDATIYGVLGGGPFDVAAPIWRELHTAFQMKLDVQSIIAEGDVIAVRYVERGASVAPFRGGSVTNKSYEIVAMEWFEMQGDRIHRRWGARDSAAIARQLGI